MSSTQISRAYLLASLDVASGLTTALQAALNDGDADSQGGDADRASLRTVVGDGCDHPIINNPPPPPPKGEGCARFLDFGTMVSNPDPIAAIVSLQTILAVVKEAVESSPPDQMYGVGS